MMTAITIVTIITIIIICCWYNSNYIIDITTTIIIIMIIIFICFVALPASKVRPVNAISVWVETLHNCPPGSWTSQNELL